MKCQHCKKNKASRAKGLCWKCSQDPAIRSLFPSTSKYTQRGLGSGNIIGLPPPFSTLAPPGSKEKQDIMQERIRQGLSPFHPDDEKVLYCLNHEEASGSKKYRVYQGEYTDLSRRQLSTRSEYLNSSGVFE